MLSIPAAFPYFRVLTTASTFSHGIGMSLSFDDSWKLGTPGSHLLWKLYSYKYYSVHLFMISFPQ